MVFTPEVGDLINKILLALLSGFLAYGLPMLYKVFKAWAEAKIAEARAKVQAIADAEERAKAEAKLRLIEFSFQRLDHIVKNTVDEVSQKYTKQTELNDDEKKARLMLAYSKVKKQLPEETAAILSEQVKDLNTYLITKIEANRFKQKKESAGNERAIESLRFEKEIEKARAKEAAQCP